MNLTKLKIRPALPEDLKTVMNVEKSAFGSETEAQLVASLLSDKSADPVVSLLAFYEKEPVGHILFTRAYLNGQLFPLLHILAPLAVIPQFQQKGVGGLLIKNGLNVLTDLGTELVFVLGHINYYPKSGFFPNALKLGFETPYKIPDEVADAWMVQELKSGSLEKYSGKIRCAEKMMRPEFWRE